MSGEYVIRAGEPILVKRESEQSPAWTHLVRKKPIYLSSSELVSSPDTDPGSQWWTFRRDGWLLSAKKHQFFRLPDASRVYEEKDISMNKIEERRLRGLILSEVKKALQESPRPATKSLKFLLEDDGGELNKLDVSKGPTATVAWLNGPGADPRVRALLNSGRKDGSPEDEAANVTERGATLGELVPTQVEIELTKSIAFPLAKFNTMKKMISGGVQRVGPPDNDTIVISGNLIIDGHHRWSSLFSVAGPKAQIAAIDVQLPEKDAASVLSIVQTAIAATMTGGEPVPKAKAGGMNILGASKEQIASMIREAVESGSGEVGPMLTDEYVMQCMKDKTVKKHFGIPDDLASVAGSFGNMSSAEKQPTSGTQKESLVREAKGNRAMAAVKKVREMIINKVAENLASMNQPADGAPPRVDMPQLDKAQGGAKAALAKLQKGKVNYKTPFDVIKGKEETTEESSSRSGNVVSERWQRLAGIVKG